MHVDGVMADKYYIQLVLLDFSILFYLMLVLAHQCYFFKCKPRIDQSTRQLRRLKIKFFCIWGTLTLLAILCDVAIVYSSKLIRGFTTGY